MPPIIPTYLDLLDNQREAALAAVATLTPTQLWQRPAPKEWSVGEILDHNYLLVARTLPLLKGAWRWLHKRGERRRARPYAIDAADPYTADFPMWVGFLWTPRYKAQNPIPLTQIATNLRDLHHQVRLFYTGKDEDVLGNIYLYDPLLGWLNMIGALRVGIHHDQLHYRDIFQMVEKLHQEGAR